MTREPTEMELRCAKAAYAANHIAWDDGTEPWDHASERDKEMHIRATRAAIRAMPVPTANMINAARKLRHRPSLGSIKAIWCAMINAASPLEPSEAQE